MNFNNLDDIRANGFIGFKTVNELWEDKSYLPKQRGVYMVLNPNTSNSQFISPGVGGFFKGKDPNVSAGELKSNLVENSLVVYIGKAGSLTGKATLHSRLGQYLSFGKGKNVGHWGGRLIWQLSNYKELIYCWKPILDNDPREIEKKLIEEYMVQFNKKPFANLVK